MLLDPAITEEKYQAKPLDVSVASRNFVQHSSINDAEKPIYRDVKVEPKPSESGLTSVLSGCSPLSCDNSDYSGKGGISVTIAVPKRPV